MKNTNQKPLKQNWTGPIDKSGKLGVKDICESLASPSLITFSRGSPLSVC